jgi:hypothetical protein
MIRANFSQKYILEIGEDINPNTHNNVSIEPEDSRTEPIESVNEQALARKNNEMNRK